MTPFLSDPDFTLWNGDVREVLRELPAESVDCALTSPPFFGLRDYGTGEWEGGDPGCDHMLDARGRREHSGDQFFDSRDGSGRSTLKTPYAALCGKCGARRVDRQIGLEATPDEWVTELVGVFREVRRVLRPAGTLWVECGDSYGSGGHNGKGFVDGGEQTALIGQKYPKPVGLKPKDLLGQPWMLAFALRGPWYIGRIKQDIDRVWLAAMVDAEGCIHIHRRKAGDSTYAPYTRKDGSSADYRRKNDSYGPMVQVANVNRRIVERCQEIYGCGSIHSSQRGRNQTIHRWCVLGEQARDLLRELYPYLVAKQHEARVVLACPTSGGEAYHEAIKQLHSGSDTTVDGPTPPGLWEPGFYLRQCITWVKPNCMPESVRDRCTTGHSYVFLLAKAPRYYFDADGIAEPNHHDGRRVDIKTVGEGSHENHRSVNGRPRWPNEGQRNARSVWSIPTQGYAEAHFATWPEALVERILKAGCPEWVCGTCGKARERLVEAHETGQRYTGQRQNMRGDTYVRAVQGERTGKAFANTTVGWSDCGHGNYRPGVALDPFMGSGTTALVARRLGRASVGVELNPEYCAMAAKRLQQLSLLADG